jgi:hypothetical protein
MKMIPIAIIALTALVPSIAIRTTASKIAGNENTSSIRRIKMVSIGSPRYAEATPTTVPPNRPIETATAATSIEMRAAKMVLESTSRPISSVPSRCCGLGGFSLPTTSIAKGE